MEPARGSAAVGMTLLFCWQWVSGFMGGFKTGAKRPLTPLFTLKLHTPNSALKQRYPEHMQQPEYQPVNGGGEEKE